MKKCPECFSEFEYRSEAGLISAVCTNCGTRSLDLNLLQDYLHTPNWKRIFDRRSSFKKSSKKKCNNSSCEIVAFDVPSAHGVVEIDICDKCNQIWLDQDEFEKAIQPDNTELKQDLPQNIKAELDQIQFSSDGSVIQQHMSYKFSTSDFKVQSWYAMKHLRWKLILALFGVPIENQNRLSAVPWVTYGMMFLICCLSIFSFHFFPRLPLLLGFIPSEPFRYGGFTSVSSFFLHGDYAHLLGNMYMLLVFGDNTEDRLGRSKYLLLIFLGTCVGCLGHYFWIGAASNIPLIGSSTGVSALIIYYALNFPRVGFSTLIGFVFWVRVPAFAYVLFWIFLQVIGFYNTEDGVVSISFAGHLGGALVGLFFYASECFLRKRK